MSSLQKFLTAIFPAAWARSMEAESRSWMIRCPCGFERSVWDTGVSGGSLVGRISFTGGARRAAS